MQPISVKFEKEFLNDMEAMMKKHRYATKTEFIREAVRDKLEELSKEQLIAEFLKFRGKAKKKTTYAENKRTKEKVSKELMAELEKRFS
jgi:Arc/MetJ-type ribon-helix-helix transcriptional regulator